MRAHIFSDLHMEHAWWRKPAADCDLAILAGDIHVGLKGLKRIRRMFRRSLPVLYVPGNHEFYGQDMDELLGQLREKTEWKNIHILEKGVFEMNGWTFLGTTLWTDFDLYGNRVVHTSVGQAMMQDFRVIRKGGQMFTAQMSREEHKKSRAWLEQELAKRKNDHVVVITHHAPTPRAIAPRYRDDPLSPAFASDLESVIHANPQIRLWNFGHVHTPLDSHIGQTRLLCNPRGYPHEVGNGFDSELVVDLRQLI